MRTELRFVGLGGQGVITLSHLLGRVLTVVEGRHAVVTEGYSPYVTGGWARADLVIADEPITYPLVSSPQVLLSLYQGGYDEHIDLVTPGGLVLLEADVTTPRPQETRTTIAVPAFSIADSLGDRKVANMVMLGALVAATSVVQESAVLSTIRDQYPKAVERNHAAYAAGAAVAEGSPPWSGSLRRHGAPPQATSGGVAGGSTT